MYKMTEKELLELKEDIEEAKQKVSELKGERQALMKRLKEDWNCGSLEEAEKKLKEMSEQVDKLSDEITEGMEELESKFEEK